MRLADAPIAWATFGEQTVTWNSLPLGSFALGFATAVIAGLLWYRSTRHSAARIDQKPPTSRASAVAEVDPTPMIARAPVMMAVFDCETRTYRYFSPYAVEVLGYSPGELIELGTAVVGAVLDPDKEANWKAHFSSLEGGPDTLTAEILLKARHKSGRRCWLLCRDRVLQRSPTGEAFQILSMALDVTLLMQTRRRIIESRNRAEAASRAKDEFLALISHELHTPLNAVMGGVQLLQTDDLTPNQIDYCGFIQEGAQSLQTIFGNLLDYCQAQAEAQVHSEDEIQLFDELEVLGAGGADLASERQLSWKMDVAEDVPIVVIGDRPRLLSVLRHLIQNAVKFTERGEVSCSVRVQRTRGNSVWLEMAVSDTGIGIDPDLHERIFEPFQQGEAIDTRRYSGTGIGLAIARRHVEAMGGTIGAQSEIGKGSCFCMVVPFRLPDSVPNSFPA